MNDLLQWHSSGGPTSWSGSAAASTVCPSGSPRTPPGFVRRYATRLRRRSLCPHSTPELLPGFATDLALDFGDAPGRRHAVRRCLLPPLGHRHPGPSIRPSMQPEATARRKGVVVELHVCDHEDATAYFPRDHSPAPAAAPCLSPAQEPTNRTLCASSMLTCSRAPSAVPQQGCQGQSRGQSHGSGGQSQSCG